MKIRVVISGRSYDVAGGVPEHLTLPEGASVDDAIEQVEQLIGDGKRLPDSCLIALSGIHLGTVRDHRPQTLADGDELVVIAPVAGG
jgi:molybdopterin converting factor small subunit